MKRKQVGWVTEYKARVEQLQIYVREVEHQRDRAHLALKDIGVGLTDADLPNTWGLATKLRHQAANHLRKEAGKPRMEKPYL